MTGVQTCALPILWFTKNKMILNRDPINFKNLWQLKNFTDFKYWHVDLHQELDLVDCIPKEIYQQITEGQIKLLLTCYREGHTFIIDKLYESKINPKNVIVFSDNLRIFEKINEIFKNNGFAGTIISKI